MTERFFRHSPLRAILGAIGSAGAFALIAPAASAATATLADNTYQIASDTLTASSSNWLAASFKADTDVSEASLQASLLASTDSGTATLALYSSDASELIPGELLGTFQPATTSGSLSTFTLDDIALQSGTSYWLVLSNSGGSSQWSWTEASGGMGTGFTGLSANSDDAGGMWFTNSSLYPLQLAVTVSAVAEPSSALLWLGGISLLVVARRRSPITRPGA